MRTFSTNITQGLTNGLSPDERMVRGAPYLQEAKNVKMTQNGLKAFEPIIDPFDGMRLVDFPFPQIFRGEGVTLLCDKTKVFLVDESKWDFRSLKPISLSGELKNIKPGGPWHFMDFKKVFFLFNGETVIWSDNTNDLFGKSAEIYASSDRKINTGTYHRGRAIFGGFDPNNFWGSEWEGIFEAWNTHYEEDFDFSFNDVGSNFVMWSSIGGGDFPLWLYKPMNTYLGTVDDTLDTGLESPDSSQLIEMLRRNEWGFMPMPWQGEVLMIKSLGNNLVVYGDEGITLLLQVNAGDGQFSTFGMKHLMSTGIASRSSVSGDENGHVFIDREGSFWAIGADGAVQRLGYTEYGFRMLGKDIVGSFNPEDSEYYFATKDEAFVYTGQGLSEIGQKFTSLEFVQGGKIGMFKALDFKKDVEIVTEVQDFGLRGIKTLTSVDLGLTGGENVRVAVEYRYTTNPDFERSIPIPVNTEGVAFPRVSGVDFRIVVLSDTYEGFGLDYITANYQVSDNRYNRGINASQVSS